MRLRRTLTAALTFVALFVAAERVAHACSCMPPGPPREEAERARAVFVGEVVEVAYANEGVRKDGEKCGQETGWQSDEQGRGDVRVRFKVTRVWKSAAGGEVVLTTPASSAACGYAFRKGESYVVYAYGGDEAPGRLTTGLCSRTRPVSAAGEDLRELGAGQPPSQSAAPSPLSTAADSAKPPTPKPRRLRRVPRRRRN